MIYKFGLKNNAMAQSPKTPLTNTQLELLKTFSHDLKDQELLELRSHLADFFSKRAIKKADEVWDKEKWSDAKVDQLLNSKLRSSVKS